MSADTADQPLVTVVTPVYNGATYLAECIESVLAQTYGRFEYVISDNASTDGSAEIARRYAEKDPRVRLVAHEEHLEYHLESLNRSMTLVSDEAAFVKVLHADDWLFDRCLELMVGLAQKHPGVGVVGSYRLEENWVTLDGLPYTMTVIDGRELGRSFLLGGPLPFVFGAASSLLIRADLVRKRSPFYQLGNIHADTEACVDLLTECDFGFVHQVLTFTRRHNQSVTTFTIRVGSAIPSEIGVLLRWGKHYLDRDDFDRKLAVRLLHYARYLAGHPMKWPSKEFRSYHRAQIASIRARVSARQVLRGLVLQARRSASLRSPRTFA